MMAEQTTTIVKRDFQFLLTCSFCTDKVKIVVNTEDYVDWMNGKLAQNAFPYLSKGEREIMISRMCERCFDNVFKDANG